MTDISSIGHGSVGPVNGFHRTGPLASTDPGATRLARPGADADDRVELSEHARFMSQLRQLPEIRADRVAEIRHQIAEGTYETDAKLDIAIARLIESFID
jgi:flagellar biosynthesis anti-sigma factor FlgM